MLPLSGNSTRNNGVSRQDWRRRDWWRVSFTSTFLWFKIHGVKKIHIIFTHAKNLNINCLDLVGRDYFVRGCSKNAVNISNDGSPWGRWDAVSKKLIYQLHFWYILMFVLPSFRSASSSYKISAEYYVKAMKKIIEKGDAYVGTEIARLERMLCKLWGRQWIWPKPFLLPTQFSFLFFFVGERIVFISANLLNQEREWYFFKEILSNERMHNS